MKKFQEMRIFKFLCTVIVNDYLRDPLYMYKYTGYFITFLKFWEVEV